MISVFPGHRPSHRGTSVSRDAEKKYLEENYQQRDLWFKAAVIAVPIAGGFILVLLVLLAVRMLRSDTRRHQQLMQIRRHRSLTKAQLYVADHFSVADSKSERSAQLNSSSTTSEKHSSLYKDVNIHIDYGGQAYDKMSDNSLQDGSCNSVIVWGKSDKPDPATVV